MFFLLFLGNGVITSYSIHYTKLYDAMNITSNIFTSENLVFYTPWFVAPFISSIVADYIISKNSKIKFLNNHSNKISGAVLGSMFFMFCFPMIAMTFLEFYVFNDVFSYDIIQSSSVITSYSIHYTKLYEFIKIKRLGIVA